MLDNGYLVIRDTTTLIWGGSFTLGIIFTIVIGAIGFALGKLHKGQ